MKKINKTLFKEAMSKFATGITIVTINKKGIYIGKTINSFSSLSMNPPLILFSIDKKSTSLLDYKKAKYIGINILSDKQSLISSHFSTKNPKWNFKNYFITSNNVPMINNCITNLNCKKVTTITQGDHIIFICEITQLRIKNKKNPLIYFDSKYKT
jgi:flavin reductase (DIM6/NTAB) family NADH-FMN oxidoreductase RutF